MVELPLAALDLGPAGWFACVLLGGLAGVDATSFPQSMVSRPLVTATVGGALFGAADGGFLVGLALELLDLRTPPFGATRYPDSGPAGLIAGAAYGAAGAAGPAAYVASVAAGWAVSRLGAHTVHWLRIANVRLVGDPRELGAPRRLERRHRLAIGLDFGRAGLLTAASLIPVLLAARLAASLAAGEPGAGLAPLAGVAGLGVAAGAAGRALGAARRLWPLVAAGAGDGILVAV